MPSSRDRTDELRRLKIVEDKIRKLRQAVFGDGGGEVPVAAYAYGDRTFPAITPPEISSDPSYAMPLGGFDYNDGGWSLTDRRDSNFDYGPPDFALVPPSGGGWFQFGVSGTFVSEWDASPGLSGYSEVYAALWTYCKLASGFDDVHYWHGPIAVFDNDHVNTYLRHSYLFNLKGQHYFPSDSTNQRAWAAAYPSWEAPPDRYYFSPDESFFGAKLR